MQNQPFHFSPKRDTLSLLARRMKAFLSRLLLFFVPTFGSFLYSAPRSAHALFFKGHLSLSLRVDFGPLRGNERKLGFVEARLLAREIVVLPSRRAK